MDQVALERLLNKLTEQSGECEWIEFKENFHENEEIGRDLSALSNGACIHNQAHGYLVFGVSDVKLIVGTTFKPKNHKKGNENFEHWLAQRLAPKVDFRIYQFTYSGKSIAMFEIQAASNRPVDFMHNAYIRIGSVTRLLKDFTEKERKIWLKGPEKPFELETARVGVSSQEVINLLDSQSLFELLRIPYPTDQIGVIDKMLKEKLIINHEYDYAITNLGAVLFAKDLSEFPSVSRKAPRVIVYKGKDKTDPLRDQVGRWGYAVAFSPMLEWIQAHVVTETIQSGIRKDVNSYPEIAIRELIANALIHQDFTLGGTGPTVEIYSDRIEVVSPGLPMIRTTRFIDENLSRNELLARRMRAFGICEERGSGIDKIIKKCEEFKLPAPDFTIMEHHTKAILYSRKPLEELDSQERIRICYQHCCLRHIANDKMSNQSLRERFEIEEKNAAIVSRIIKETFEEGLIKPENINNASRKFARFVPFWA